MRPGSVASISVFYKIITGQNKSYHLSLSSMDVVKGD
jgi:hypothetical protein